MTMRGIGSCERGANTALRVRAMPVVQAVIWYDEQYWVEGPEGERERFTTRELAECYAEGLLGSYMRAERCPRLVRAHHLAVGLVCAFVGAFVGLSVVDLWDIPILGHSVDLAAWRAACLMAAVCLGLAVYLVERGWD